MEFKENTQGRKWQLTFNNPAEHDINHDFLKAKMEELKVDYYCMGDEIGQEGTYHTHLFFYSKKHPRFSTLKKMFPSAHIEMCNGSVKQNIDYISKEATSVENTFEQFGEVPDEQQGRRTDIIQLHDLLEAGYDDYEIIEENPSYLLSIDKIQKVRQVFLEHKFREEFRQLEVIYIYGSAGVGKSRYVMENEGYKNCYRVTDYTHPFDSYQGQNVLIFEEFRSSLKIQDMLNYLDGYPLTLPARFQNRQACFTKVYILTNIPLNRQYTETQSNSPETWKAFLRRLHKIYFMDSYGELIEQVDYKQTTLEDLPF